jgi:antitoxin component YwqK of YwqJK toxin-antitoxin module
MFKSTVTSQELVERDKKYYTKEDSELFSGKVEDKYKNGKTSFVGQYKNGIMTGEFVTYFENGQIQKKENYLLGTQEGKVEEFNDDGSLRTSYVMKDGKYPDGPIKFLDKEGFVFDFTMYKDNKLITKDFKSTNLYYSFEDFDDKKLEFSLKSLMMIPTKIISLFKTEDLIEGLKEIIFHTEDLKTFSGNYIEFFTYENCKRSITKTFPVKSVYICKDTIQIKLILPIKDGKMNGKVHIISNRGPLLEFETQIGMMNGKYFEHSLCFNYKLNDQRKRCDCKEFLGYLYSQYPLYPDGTTDFSFITEIENYPIREIYYKNNKIDNKKIHTQFFGKNTCSSSDDKNYLIKETYSLIDKSCLSFYSDGSKKKECEYSPF